MKKKLAIILVVVAALLFGGIVFYNAHHPPITATVSIAQPAPFEQKDVADKPLAVPEKPPLAIVSPKPSFATYVPSPIIKPPAVKPAATDNGIDSPFYIFKPVPGVEYKDIWFKVPQQSLKYIRLN